MLETGRAVRQLKWTDQELLDQIDALRFTIAYLNGREDSRIVVYALDLDLQSFLSIKDARGI